MSSRFRRCECEILRAISRMLWARGKGKPGRLAFWRSVDVKIFAGQRLAASGLVTAHLDCRLLT